MYNGLVALIGAVIAIMVLVSGIISFCQFNVKMADNRMAHTDLSHKPQKVYVPEFDVEVMI